MRRNEEPDRRIQRHGSATTLRSPELFADAEPTADARRRLSRTGRPEDTAENSITVRLRLARSCAGWGERPTSAEFYDAIRTENPSRRQRTILHVFAQEAEWDELVSAWAEGAYTVRELVGALHRAGHAQCRAARVINRWADVTRADAE